MTQQSERHVPAAGRRGLEALYDPVMALTMRERAFRAAITDLALTAPDDGPIIDLGCGTGSQLLQLARLAPGRELIGIDLDTAILERARGKFTAAGVSARLLHGSADALSLDDTSVVVAITSLVMHHLTPATRLRTLVELARVLQPGGRLIVVDWGKPTGPVTRFGFRLLRMLDGFQNTAEHAAGQLPTLIARVGFEQVANPTRWSTAWGTLELWTANRPT